MFESGQVHFAETHLLSSNVTIQNDTSMYNLTLNGKVANMNTTLLAEAASFVSLEIEDAVFDNTTVTGTLQITNGTHAEFSAKDVAVENVSIVEGVLTSQHISAAEV